ncbi:MAG: hypothetical protein AAF242_16385, partial [Bacteroidota bacterium]
TPGNGYAAQYGYTITYVRTSFNPADPSCMRTDTARLSYCCGDGRACDLALGAVPTSSCGGLENEIGPLETLTDGLYYWSRQDGQPLNNELFDPNTGDTLTSPGPHPARIVASPSGLTAVVYTLTFIYNNPGPGDTCDVDITIFPEAVSKPNVDYTSPQAICQDEVYTIVGPAEQPGLNYAWSPSNAFATLADTAEALPDVSGLDTDTELFITVTDPSTGCVAMDTVQLLVTPVSVDAGADASFCEDGATVEIGSTQPITGYIYQWTADPPAGVVFADDAAPTTTATLPALTAGQSIDLILTATNGLTSANCMLSDTAVYTASSAPSIVIPTVGELCTGGQRTIGPVTPSGPGITYTWLGPGIVSGAGTNTIIVDMTGTYDVTVSQGTCTSNASVTVNPVVEPTVDLAPAAPCAGDVEIGVNNLSEPQRRQWTFSWDNYSFLRGNASDLSTITVRPSTNMTYTLTATHNSGCVLTFPVVVPAAAYVAELPYTLNFCEGDNAVLPLSDFSGVAGASVVWTANPSSAAAYLNNVNANEPILDLNAAAAGQYTYIATVTYDVGCTAIDSVLVNIGKEVQNIAGSDQEICEGDCVQLGTTPIITNSYVWTSDPVDPNFTITSVPRPTVCPTQTTTYTLTYTDLAGCTFRDEVLVIVNESPDLVVQAIDTCQNDMGTLMVDLNDAIINNTGISTTFWQDANALVASANPVTDNTIYYIQSENANTCTTILPVSVDIFENPTGTVTPGYNC